MPTYTLNELIKKMEPQARRDKALINRCVDGLGLYAAQIAVDNGINTKVDSIRNTVVFLVKYWGLEDGETAKPLDDYIDAFDKRVYDAKISRAVTGDVFQTAPNVIYGLYRYGEDMVTSQGDEAMSDILDMNDLMKEIAAFWDFESEVVSDLSARLESEVRDMLKNIPLPGHPVSGLSNIGYKIEQAVLFENNRGIALAHNPRAVSPFVTWMFIKKDNFLDYEWGNYFITENRVKIDFLDRVAKYRDIYNFKEVPLEITAAEMETEQNYNMLDGVNNNTVIIKLDLTDGQTHEEIRELAPETLPEGNAEEPKAPPAAPVQALTEIQPMVTVTYSEFESLTNIKNMPLYLADILFAEVDSALRENRNENIPPYFKTDFRIDFVKNGEADSYVGHYDVGDGGGSLTNHISDYAGYYKNNEDYQSYLAEKGGGEQQETYARLSFVSDELVPYFKKHSELSELETAAAANILSIYEAAAGCLSEADVTRVAYLESVAEYAGRSREALNSTGLDSLTEPPLPAAANTEDKQGRDEKPSVLEQIRAAQNAPKQPREPKKDQNKKNHKTEL